MPRANRRKEKREAYRKSPITSQEAPYRIQFIRIDRVSHALVDPLVDDRAHSSKDFRGFVHAFERDVRIDVAAPEKHRAVQPASPR